MSLEKNNSHPSPRPGSFHRAVLLANVRSHQNKIVIETVFTGSMRCPHYCSVANCSSTTPGNLFFAARTMLAMAHPHFD